MCCQHDEDCAFAGVLDIAGGSGALSFCLQTVHGVRCTTIDPRPAKLSKQQRRHMAQLLKVEIQQSSSTSPGMTEPADLADAGMGFSSVDEPAQDELFGTGSGFLHCGTVRFPEGVEEEDPEGGLHVTVYPLKDRYMTPNHYLTFSYPPGTELSLRTLLQRLVLLCLFGRRRSLE